MKAIEAKFKMMSHFELTQETTELVSDWLVHPLCKILV